MSKGNYTKYFLVKLTNEGINLEMGWIHSKWDEELFWLHYAEMISRMEMEDKLKRQLSQGAKILGVKQYRSKNAYMKHREEILNKPKFETHEKKDNIDPSLN